MTFYLICASAAAEGGGGIKGEEGEKAVVGDERTIKRGKEQGWREVAPDDELGIFVLPENTQARSLASSRARNHAHRRADSFPLRLLGIMPCNSG